MRKFALENKLKNDSLLWPVKCLFHQMLIFRCIHCAVISCSGTESMYSLSLSNMFLHLLTNIYQMFSAFHSDGQYADSKVHAICTLTLNE